MKQTILVEITYPNGMTTTIDGTADEHQASFTEDFARVWRRLQTSWYHADSRDARGNALYCPEQWQNLINRYADDAFMGKL